MGHRYARDGLGLAAALLLAAAACAREGGEDARRQARRAGADAQQAAEPQRRQEPERRQPSEQQAAATPRPSEAERSVRGQVVRAGQLEVVLRRGGGEPDLRLTVGPETTVVVHGRAGTMSDLREGAQVRASWDEQDGVPRARRIEVQEGR